MTASLPAPLPALLPALDLAPPVEHHLFPGQTVADHAIRRCTACPYAAFDYRPDQLARRTHACAPGHGTVTWTPPREVVDVVHERRSLVVSGA